MSEATGLETLEEGKDTLALGVPRERAALGTVGKGPWRMAANEGLSNAFWRKQGLRSIAERYHQLRVA